MFGLFKLFSLRTLVSSDVQRPRSPQRYNARPVPAPPARDHGEGPQIPFGGGAPVQCKRDARRRFSHAIFLSFGPFEYSPLNNKRQTVFSISKFTKVILFATPKPLFAFYDVEMRPQTRSGRRVGIEQKCHSSLGQRHTSSNPGSSQPSQNISHILRCSGSSFSAF